MMMMMMMIRHLTTLGGGKIALIRCWGFGVSPPAENGRFGAARAKPAVGCELIEGFVG